MCLWRHRIESRDMLSPAIFIPPTIDKRQLLLYLCIIIIQYRNMKNSTDTRLLRRDLVRAAREILDMRARSGIGPELSLRALAALALAQRPRAHYISFDRASALVHAWRRGEAPQARAPLLGRGSRQGHMRLSEHTPAPLLHLRARSCAVGETPRQILSIRRFGAGYPRALFPTTPAICWRCNNIMKSYK